MLFVPGSRADMVAKIDRFGPDVAVIDLEDAVAVGAKVEARNTVVAAISALHEAERTRLYIRVNPVDSPWFAEDLPAAAPTGVSGIVIPKLSSVRDLERVQQSLAAAAWPTAQIVVGIETVRAVADARSLLDAGVHGAYFGAEDYIADIGGKRTTAGHEVLYARSYVCLAAQLADVWIMDQAVVALDEARFLADAEAGATIGYHGKICIHPSQVALSHRIFTPSEEDVIHALSVIAAAESGVAAVDNQMVDEVHVRMARRVLTRAGVR
jgi:citrate lyase subunit beta/citryl-CoA lyase